MNIKKVFLIYFSPGGNTKKVLRIIGGEIEKKLGLPVQEVDFTLPKMRETQYSFEHDDLIIFGTPTYAGRIPNKILPFVQNSFSADAAAAVAITTFGNRNFDSSPAELSQELANGGFRVFAAASFACQHHFSSKIGTNRPDEKDVGEIKDFTAKIIGKLTCEAELCKVKNVLLCAEVKPYYIPLGIDGNPAKFLKAVPGTNMDKCDRCGMCIAVCPMGIVAGDIETITGACIKCQACVVNCHTQAKYFDDKAFLSHVKMLEENYTSRADNFTLIAK
ncbi:MAG: EFR1 family ferrodoxin [Eubacterium sp.]|nr:EFR1 family ferrodoxin [Eubacterium sp.]